MDNELETIERHAFIRGYVHAIAILLRWSEAIVYGQRRTDLPAKDRAIRLYRLKGWSRQDLIASHVDEQDMAVLEANKEALGI